jgi:chromosome segregation ATPase
MNVNGKRADVGLEVRVCDSDPDYKRLYEQLKKEGRSYEGIAKTLATIESERDALTEEVSEAEKDIRKKRDRLRALSMEMSALEDYWQERIIERRKKAP